MVNKHYQKHKKTPKRSAREIYQNLSEEAKDKKQKKDLERYQNFTEEEKKGISIIRNVSKSYLIIEETII